MPPTTRRQSKNIEIVDISVTIQPAVEDEKSKMIKARYLPLASSSSTQTLENAPASEPKTPTNAEEDVELVCYATAQKHGRDDDTERTEEAKRSKTAATSDRLDLVKQRINALLKDFTALDQEREHASNEVEYFRVESKYDKDAISSKQAQINELQEELKASKTQCRSLKSNNQKLREATGLLGTQTQLLRSENQKLEKENESLQKSNEDWEGKYTEVLKELKPDYGDPDKVTDEGIFSMWQRLNYLVQNIATEAITVPPNICAPRVTPSIDELIKTCAYFPGLTIPLVQQHIWRRLCNDIFKARGGIWGGLMGEKFVATIGKLTALFRDYPKSLSLISRMKYKTGKDIDTEIGLNMISIGNVIENLQSELTVISPPDKKDMLRGILFELYHAAAELMVIMTRSRALFNIDMDALYRHDGSHPFDPQSMRVIFTSAWVPEVTEDRKVRFLVSPPLEKIGTADGGKFDRRFFVCKAGAIVYRPADSG